MEKFEANTASESKQRSPGSEEASTPPEECINITPPLIEFPPHFPYTDQTQPQLKSPTMKTNHLSGLARKQRPNTSPELSESDNIKLHHLNGASRLKVLNGSGIPDNVEEFLKQSTEIQQEIKKLSNLCRQISPTAESSKASVKDWSKPNMKYLKEEDEVSEIEGSIMWGQINGLLNKYGFKPVNMFEDEEMNLVPDFESLAETLVDLLTEYVNQNKTLSDAESDIQRLLADMGEVNEEKEALNSEILRLKANEEDRKRAENQLRELNRHNRHLSEKLHRIREKCKAKEGIINEMKVQLDLTSSQDLQKVFQNFGSEKERKIFRTFLNREYRPTSGSDSKVMGLILMYEDSKLNYEKSIKELKDKLSYFKENFDLKTLKEHHDDAEKRAMKYYYDYTQLLKEHNTLISKYNHSIDELRSSQDLLKQKDKEISSLRSPSSKHSSPRSDQILEKLLTSLELNHYYEIPIAIEKMQQVLRTVPTVERFVQLVCEELFPELKNRSDRMLCAQKMEEVIPTLQEWKSNIIYSNKFMQQIRQALGMDMSFSDASIVRCNSD